MEQLFSWYEEKFKNLSERELILKKSLVFFEDADDDEMPDMLVPCEWDDVKKLLRQEVKKLG